jgi:hypothetical protein
MMHDPLVFVVATAPARQLAHSARPDAPVVPDAPRRRRARRPRPASGHDALTLHRARGVAALSLRRLADRLQPT